MKAYVVKKGSTGFDGIVAADLPKPEAGPGEVLVRMRAASINFRDLAIATGKYIFGPVDRDTVPLSDGAGEVEVVGEGVTLFSAGDRVVATFTQGYPPASLGCPTDGVLAEYRVFRQEGLVHVPGNLSFEEAATLPCAGVTAWNALTEGKSIRPGDTVVTLGTGGVSLFVLQLGKVAGARVIITSSSDKKLERAKALGADDGINYTENPDWDKVVMEVTNGQGADHVVDLGGVGTLPNSYKAVGDGGEVLLIGVQTRPDGDLSPYPLMPKQATLRGIFVGPPELLSGLCRAMEVNDIHPVIDRVYEFDDAPEAWPYLKSGEHFGKVVVRI